MKPESIGVFFIFWISVTKSFNISPIPNILIETPNLPTHIPKNRSSYFGYSITLRLKSIMIGAPRDQSTVFSQANINEPGVIYKCTWSSNVSCHAYNFDSDGHKIFEKSEVVNGKKIRNDAHEWKNNQMLGATMDGMNSESDLFVACAPNFIAYRWVAQSSKHVDLEHMNGVCYSVKDTKGDQPQNSTVHNPISNLTMQEEISKNLTIKFIFGMAQQGFSLHVNNEGQTTIGAPGIYDGKGSIFTMGANEKNRIAAPTISRYIRVPYTGYAVTSGKFDKHSSKTYFVASAPRIQYLNGEVHLLEMKDNMENFQSYTKYFKSRLSLRYNFTAEQFGDYFGYALLADDFNGDGHLDLAVSAPLYSDHEIYDLGAVYIFLNDVPEKGKRVLCPDIEYKIIS